MSPEALARLTWLPEQQPKKSKPRQAPEASLLSGPEALRLGAQQLWPCKYDYATGSYTEFEMPFKRSHEDILPETCPASSLPNCLVVEEASCTAEWLAAEAVGRVSKE